MRIMDVAYHCEKCGHFFTKRLSPPTQLIFFMGNSKNVIGALCPTCKDDVMGFLKSNNPDLDKRIVSDVVGRL